MSKNFQEALRNHISKEKQKNPSLSEVSISKKMDIAPTTFNRLVNGHSKPSSATLIKLLQFIPELKSSLPKEISQILEVTLERKNKEYIETALETLLSDKYLFLCWALSFSEKGTTKEEIKEHFGKEGLTALETLVKKDIVSKNEDNTYKVAESNKDTILSFHLIKSHLMFLAERYKPNKIKGNYIHYWVESLSEKGRKKLIDEHREFHRKVRKIMDNEENRGSELVFSVACSDTFLDEESNGGV